MGSIKGYGIKGLVKALTAGNAGFKLGVMVGYVEKAGLMVGVMTGPEIARFTNGA